MNINNINRPAPYTFCIASMCIDRINKGEPNTAPYPYDVTLDRRDWHDEKGNPITVKEMMKLTGKRRDVLVTYHTRYKGDCYEIFKRHGKTAGKSQNSIKYADKDGTKLSQEKLCDKYNVSRNAMRKAFKKANFDHVQAFKILGL